MSATRTRVFVILVATFALSATETLHADDEHFYESLPDVDIGKVFFSPEQRTRLDQRRGSSPRVSSNGGSASAASVRKVNDDAAGFITSSKGTSKVYSDGDFVNVRRGVAVEFPGSVKIIRQKDPDDAEASDEAD